MIKRFKTFIYEMALPLSLYKQYARNWKPDILLLKIFSWYDTGLRKNKKPFRIYLPYNKNEKYEKISNKHSSKIITNINEILLILYNEKIVKKLFTVENYILGIASTDDGKNKMKIGKLLNLAIRKIPENKNKELAKKTLKYFENDPIRKNIKNDKMMVVISNHAYDILGKSTNRGWTSCMNILTGANKHYIYAELQNRILVAYLIKENDPNIEKPIARLQINCYVNINDSTKMIFLPSMKTYGSSTKEFEQTVWNWCHDVNKRLNRNNYFDSIYRIPGPCYTHDFQKEIDFLNIDDIFTDFVDNEKILFLLSINDFYIFKKVIKEKKYIYLYDVLKMIFQENENENFLKTFYDFVTPEIVYNIYRKCSRKENIHEILYKFFVFGFENRKYKKKTIELLDKLFDYDYGANIVLEFLKNWNERMYISDIASDLLKKFIKKDLKHSYVIYLDDVLIISFNHGLNLINDIKNEIGIERFFETGNEESLFLDKNVELDENDFQKIIKLDSEKDIFTLLYNLDYKIKIDPNKFLEFVKNEYSEKHIKELINNGKITSNTLTLIGIPEKIAEEFLKEYSIND